MSKIVHNKLILGTVQMGLAYGINNTAGKVSIEESHAILAHAFDNGIKILDSAEAYGNAHQVIGSFHKKNPDKSFEVITKLPHQLDASIPYKVNSYLSDLQVNHLHALLFHSFSSYQENTANMKVLTDLKAQDVIKYIGVSVYTNEEIEALLLDDTIDIIQLPFNLFDNVNLRGDILEKATAKGKIIHTRSALLQGLFFKEVDSDHHIVKKLRDPLVQLSMITNIHDISIVQLALQYCLQQKSIDNVLIGVDSKSQLEDNLQAIKLSLDAGILGEVNTIRVPDKNLLNPSLWN